MGGLGRDSMQVKWVTMLAPLGEAGLGLDGISRRDAKPSLDMGTTVVSVLPRVKTMWEERPNAIVFRRASHPSVFLPSHFEPSQTLFPFSHPDRMILV